MSSSRDVTANRKKEVWEEAGAEFYQESYPSGSGQATQSGHHRRPSRLNIPLPSQTARRNSNVGDAGRKSSRRKTSITAMTYNSTMAVGTTTNDIHVAVLPDLADESIPNEMKTWEEMLKVKAMPISMAQKKELKSQLTTLPILKLKGWRLFKWRKLKAFTAISSGWSHYLRNFVFLQTALRHIEIKCGTSIVNVFLFIKWTLILNVLMFIIIALFVIIPFAAHHGGGGPTADLASTCPVDSDGPFTTEHEMISCCSLRYKKDLLNESRDSIATFIEQTLNMTKGSIVDNAFFYGYYEARGRNLDYNLALAYALVTATIFVLCLALMVRNIGRGFKEMILAREGEYYKYSNLIFGGWDHYTNDDAGAKFKRKVILNEMKIVLQTEKIKTQDLIRSSKQSMKLRCIQGIMHIVVLLLWAFIGILIHGATELSVHGNENYNPNANLKEKAIYLLQDFCPSLVIIISNLIFPIILSWLGKFEKYSIEAQTTLILIRALFVRLLGIGLPAYLFYQDNYCETKNSHCTDCKDNPTTDKRRSRVSCWETTVSEQIYKLILTDIVLKLLITFVWEPSRKLVAIICPCQLAKKFSRIRFNIVRHSLDIIYIQALSWIGFYFSPVLPGIVACYCLIVFYTKKYSVLYNCNAVPDTFRTTRTTTIFIFTKLFSFIAATITIVVVLGYMIPSKGCGPFRSHSTPWNAVNKSLSEVEVLHKIVEIVVSPGVTTPITILLILGTYYYYSVAQANRGMVETLKHLLVLEGHDKQYLFARLNTLRRKSTDSDRSSYSTVNAEAGRGASGGH